MEQTAIEKLIATLKGYINENAFGDEAQDRNNHYLQAINVAKQHLPIEQQQIEKAFEAGLNSWDENEHEGIDITTSVDYYTQTYRK